MRKKNFQTKALAVMMSAVMAAGSFPVSLQAEGVSYKDGTYIGTATVHPDEFQDFDAYEIKVAVTIAQGAVTSVTYSGDCKIEDDNVTYANRAMNGRGSRPGIAAQMIQKNGVDGIDTVSTATCSSKAIISAAASALSQAVDTSASIDTAALEQAIYHAEGLTSADYTENSWSAVQAKLSAAKEALEKKESQDEVTAAANALEEAIQALEAKEAQEKISYVLMNIPYDQFYRADVNNNIPVDGFSSATLNKTRTKSLAGGSYHVKSDGSEITGITFPVKVPEGTDLSAYKRIKDTDSVEITVTNRGQTSTTTYSGKDALFESASYSYYVLSETPAYYKELKVLADGSLSFGKTVGNVQKVTGASAELSTESSYGDYQLAIDGLDINSGTDTVYGVVISTKEGNDYGLRHLENIWRVTELAWCTGFTQAVHNCPTSSAHYAAMMGQTIDKVTYYTSKGIYEILLNDIYIPIKFNGGVKVQDASVKAGKTKIEIEGLPDDYDARYDVEGLDGITVDHGMLTFSEADKGLYTLSIQDRSGKYAQLKTSTSSG